MKPISRKVPASRPLAWLVLALAALPLTGCAGAGWIAQAIESEATIDITAEYRGLDNQRVAVLVDMDLSLQFQHPLLQLEVATALSDKIAANVPGVTVLNAEQMVDFQNRNIYWNTMSFADLAQRLGVTRLVLVDVVEFRLHERGNVNIFKGYLQAGLSVAETDGGRPNDLAYATTVAASYPPKSSIGVVKADPRVIRFGTLDLWAHQSAGKFYDRTEKKYPE